MKGLLIIILIAFAFVPVYAQTDTPTPTPTLRFQPMIFATVPSPTPIPTSTPFELPTPEIATNGLIDSLATAENTLRNAPADLSAAIPTQNGSELFGYAKWLLSPNTAQEVAGPFALLITHISIAISAVLLFAVAYFTILIAVFIIRFIVWIVSLLKRIPFL